MKTDEEMESFDDVYAMNKSHVYRFACALAGTVGEAEDLFQETWLRVAEAARRGSGPADRDAKAWLLTITANLHKDALRKRRVRRLFLLERTRGLAPGRGADADPGWDSPGSSPRDVYESADLRICLRRAVSRLPARERRVFVLKDIEGFKHAEIGRMLDIPEATVRTLLHRAVMRLQKDMAEFDRTGKSVAVLKEEGA